MPYDQRIGSGMTKRLRFLSAFLPVLATACDKVAPLFESPRPASAHERYADGLERAGLEKTALGRDWLAAARSSIQKPLTVALPFRETGYFAASEARAMGYAISLRNGQKLSRSRK